MFQPLNLQLQVLVVREENVELYLKIYLKPIQLIQLYQNRKIQFLSIVLIYHKIIEIFDRLEPSAVFESSRKIEDSVLATPEIISSQKEEPSDLSNIAYNPRAGLTTTITSIAYTTSYQFKATALTSTITLGASTGLVCLPSGYTICA